MTEFASLLSGVANFAVVNADLQNYLRPIMYSLVGLAGVVSTFFIIQGGIEYMTSSGKPEKLEHAKKIMRNALIGLVIVIAAGTLTSILTSAYQESGGSVAEQLPVLESVPVEDGGGGITEVLINAIIGLFKHIITAAGKPFIEALSYFTHETPLMAENPAVFKLWLTVLGIANVLFVLGVALIGFQVMSAASFGLEEMEFKQLLPKLIATFLLMNMSIFAIDAVISLSNAMISAVENIYSASTVWDTLKLVAEGSDTYGFVALLVMVVFLILSLMLLVFYVLRIVTLYVGAVLAPIVALLQIIPGFKDFSLTAIKAYIVNVFVLFLHVIILTLTATLFAGIRADSGTPNNAIMSLIVGVAALLALLRTQAVLMQMTYVSAGPRAMRRLGTQFMNGVSYTTQAARKYNRRLEPQTDTFTPSRSSGRQTSSGSSSKPKTTTKEGYK